MTGGVHFHACLRAATFAGVTVASPDTDEWPVSCKNIVQSDAVAPAAVVANTPAAIAHRAITDPRHRRMAFPPGAT
jgi:hypothetical protein